MRNASRLRRVLVGACVTMVVGVAMTAGVASATSIVPVNPTPGGLPDWAESGRINQDVKCTLPILGSQTFTEQMSGTLSTEFAPGQSFYLTDGSGSLTIPSYLVTLLRLFGTKYISGTINTLDFGVLNGSPSTFNAASPAITIPKTQLIAGKALTLQIPGPGNLLNVGPIDAGLSGDTTLQIGAAGGSVRLLDSSGNPLLGLPALGISCSAPSPTVTLIAVNIAGLPTTAVSAPATGQQVNTAPVPLGYFAGTVRTPLSCTANGTPVGIDASETATDDPNVAQNGSFDFIDASGSLTLPASYVNTLISEGVASASGSISTLDIDQDGGSPAVVNAADPAFTVGSHQLVANQPITINLPEGGGSYTVGPFGVGTGSVDIQTQGPAGGTLNLADAGGNPVGSPVTVSCAAPSPQVIVNAEGIIP